jgi:hypothetical protein
MTCYNKKLKCIYIYIHMCVYMEGGGYQHSVFSISCSCGGRYCVVVMVIIGGGQWSLVMVNGARLFFLSRSSFVELKKRKDGQAERQ